MRTPSKTLLAILAITTVAASSVTGSTDGLAAREPQPEFTQPIPLRPRHGDDGDMPHTGSNVTASNSTVHVAPSHTHGHDHGVPKLELNETEILEKFGPDPLSYYAHDFQLEGEKGLGGLMIFHIAVMSLAFFVVLPFAIVLRSAKHKAHGLVNGIFLAMTALGFFSGSAYKKLSPDLYEGSVHGKVGSVLLLIVNVLGVIDSLPLIRRFYDFVRAGPSEWTPSRLWYFVLRGQEEGHSRRWIVDDSEEEIKLTADPEEIQHSPVEPAVDSEHAQRVHERLLRFNTASTWVNQGEESSNTREFGRIHRHGSPMSRHSIGSEATLHDLGSPSRPWPIFSSPKVGAHEASVQQGWKGRIQSAGHWTFNTMERIMIPFAWGVTMVGGCVYTGICRGSYLNGCLAHFIKGSIFFWYGMLTWARYLGAWSDRGWAWNRTTSKRVSAEMVESFVIFLYGATNTWMERFGAQPGDPYTTKQIQHISIAVMFWFAGLVGMGLESRTVRRLLSNASIIGNPRARNHPITEPPSYSGSFNPFPAIVIGVTGAAMSAHHQNYVFQVKIHELWGNLLVGFAVMRCFTYFFVWLRPARSILPSRPPTEAIASFFLAAGGLAFISSSEPITFAAMRSGRDDIMMFLNAIIALVSLAYAINLLVLTLKGWAIARGELAVTTSDEEDLS
ncbi:putative membrane protein C3B8,06 [Schizosaccharomyces pombe 972h-] [Rhizoctonia solani]|uniref:Putative membrane protein C3B8,06 [Schizosaccharomyces pombe 972h-] n=1 Tax=Rhizoctonia solani TaxID=456999 RepID=A0A0K6G5A9_9AGAM|nr:putative membrane protein C3B8,06 [Schizosaccharomyces pombe 972h-] [Rhizoctonia solani]